MDFWKDLSLSNVLISTILPIFIPIFITLMNEKKSKKGSTHQISIELAGINRHFRANLKVLDRIQKDNILYKIDFEKLVADDNFLQTISLENLHTLHLQDEIILDVLQTVLVVRNTDLVVKDLLSKYFLDLQVSSSQDIINNINGLMNRYSNLEKRINALHILIEDIKMYKHLNNPYISVWDQKIEILEAMNQTKS